MRPRHVVVLGLMGSGKTTVGTRLARALDVPYRDSDADLRAATGSSAREIAARDGIDALHALELRHLLDALAAPGPSVISAAASTIDDPEGRAALADPTVHVVFLRIDPAVAAQRVTKGTHRPSPEDLRIQAARRDPRFRSVADQEVDTGATRPRAIVRSVVDRVTAGSAADEGR
jgi:shikimate kinase